MAFSRSRYFGSSLEQIIDIVNSAQNGPTKRLHSDVLYKNLVTADSKPIAPSSSAAAAIAIDEKTSVNAKKTFRDHQDRIIRQYRLPKYMAYKGLGEYLQKFISENGANISICDNIHLQIELCKAYLDYYFFIIEIMKKKGIDDQTYVAVVKHYKKELLEPAANIAQELLNKVWSTIRSLAGYEELDKINLEYVKEGDSKKAWEKIKILSEKQPNIKKLLENVAEDSPGDLNKIMTESSIKALKNIRSLSANDPLRELEVQLGKIYMAQLQLALAQGDYQVASEIAARGHEIYFIDDRSELGPQISRLYSEFYYLGGRAFLDVERDERFNQIQYSTITTAEYFYHESWKYGKENGKAFLCIGQIGEEYLTKLKTALKNGDYESAKEIASQAFHCYFKVDRSSSSEMERDKSFNFYYLAGLAHYDVTKPGVLASQLITIVEAEKYFKSALKIATAAQKALINQALEWIKQSKWARINESDVAVVAVPSDTESSNSSDSHASGSESDEDQKEGSNHSKRPNVS